VSVAINFAGAKTAPSGEKRGIDVAVESLLTGLFRYGAQETYPVSIDVGASLDALQNVAVGAGLDRAQIPPVGPADLDGLTLFRQDPDLARLAWRRQQFGARAYSLCGLVHTMSGGQTMSLVGDYLTAPTQAWDALICPSTAIRGVVERLWESWSDYMAARTGAPFQCPVRLPVIPLGIDTDKFRPSAERRAAQRRALGVSEDAIVALCHGRLSYVFKQHPLPVLVAAEQTAKAVDRPVHLIFSGYFHPASLEADFRDSAAAFCNSAQVRFVGNDDPDFPEGLWDGADLFISLSDNIQESFGLTPIEAMAAGLPVIISDWDGYRDAITPGQEGFAAPTIMPGPGNGGELSDRYFSGEDVYGEYLAGASLSTSVDIKATTEALTVLASNDDLRARMGAAGRARACDVYDWRRIIPRYEELWAELSDIRARSTDALAPISTNGLSHPSYPDPFAGFQDFASAPLRNEDCIAAIASHDYTKTIYAQRMNIFRSDLLLDSSSLIRLIQLLRRDGGMTVAAVVDEFDDAPKVMRSLGWLLKMGICVMLPNPGDPSI
jgi:alpha-maltose-1-phosphate synthase